ncbi:uncharacterized protein CDAR_17161 [Caerostris darwini]|uniref:Gustatory receptor n=1 Tax=Caerostris darwini TaxID=1538125 RepID=A0AAV4N484_9ARAC|nr:uncharacterized protein CDAR_17161 [Caerostris darwini]
MYCSALYTGLGIVLRQDYIAPNATIIAESLFTIAMSVFSIISLMTFASSIPAAMSETRKIFRKLYQQVLQEGYSVPIQQLMLFKYFGEIELFYLTAWDLFRMDKHSILSILGTSISFCILIMQLKRVDLEGMT